MSSQRPSTESSTIVTLKHAKSLVEAYLDAYFDERLPAARALDPSYESLWKAVRSLYAAGGKRLRPYLTLLSYQAFAPEADIRAVVPAAAAQELLHLAMLIHDDMIDRDLVRYGVSNVSGRYEQRYAELLPDPAERGHFVDSAALLAGDALLSDAYRLIAKTDAPAETVLQAQAILNDAVFTVIGGELIDTESAFTDTTTQRPLEVARTKTASYSFISPLVMGAVFAGTDEATRAKLAIIGEATGIAYQLQDDLLGTFGDVVVTGKSTTGDLSEGKYTYLVQLFEKRASDAQQAEFAELFGRGDLTDAEADRARSILIEAGAKQDIEEYIDVLSGTALSGVSELDIPGQYRDALHGLIGALKKRER